MSRRLGAEFLGTAWLVFGGCGSAVLAAAFPELGIGFVGVSLAFGLTVLTMAFAVGHISGGHFNPAVTVGLWAGGRFKSGEILPYWAAQVAGALARRVPPLADRHRQARVRPRPAAASPPTGSPSTRRAATRSSRGSWRRWC